MNYNHVFHEFDIVIDKDTKILILGSFPSVKSREHSFYYMHPKNRFWMVLKAIFNDDFTNHSIEIKKELLHKYHIGLYDVVTECDIIGSSDVSIKNVHYLDIFSILDKYDIKKIFLNGNKAYELFIKAFPSLENKVIRLPSTSPANAKFKVDDLVGYWKEIIKYYE